MKKNNTLNPVYGLAYSYPPLFYHVIKLGPITVIIRKRKLRKFRIRRERPASLGYVLPNKRVI